MSDDRSGKVARMTRRVTIMGIGLSLLIGGACAWALLPYGARAHTLQAGAASRQTARAAVAATLASSRYNASLDLLHGAIQTRAMGHRALQGSGASGTRIAGRLSRAA